MTTEIPDQPTQTDAQEAAAYVPDPRRWRVLAVTLLIGFMALLDVTIVNVAIPSIRQGLDASAGQVQWVVSGYALTFGLTLVAGGRLGDAYGRRRMMLIGLAGFVASSAAVGLAPNAELVVLARLVQGIAAGLLTPQNTGVIQQLFRGAERGRAFGYFGLTVSVSAALGPVVGGLIIAALGDDLGWRAIFLVNVPIGVVAMFFVARMLPGRPGGATPRIDVLGALLLGAGVLAVLYPTVSAMDGAGPGLAVLALAPLLFWMFVRWERRTVRLGGAPLLDVALLRRVGGYGSGLALGSLYFTGFTGVFLVLSIHLQEGLGYSPLATGLLLTAFASGSALTSAPAGKAVARTGRWLTVGALLVVMLGLGVVTVVVPMLDGAPMQVVLVSSLLLAGLGGGAVVSPNFTLTLANVPPRMGGAAGGAVQTGQRIGSAMGAALMVTAYHVAINVTDDVQTGLRVAVACSLVIIACALAIAVVDLRRDVERNLD
ncbi:MAG TPA: MFS transporter [Marmoricola sp.]|nr:MFS transporter [Marmoricola sp.]